MKYQLTESKEWQLSKKRKGEYIKFVLLSEIGNCKFFNLKILELEKVLSDLCQF